MNIENAKYGQGITVVDGNTVSDGINNRVTATIDGVEMSVPLDKANRHYAEILKQVEAGTLTIAPAETTEV